jgi:hypothetical protein
MLKMAIRPKQEKEGNDSFSVLKLCCKVITRLPFAGSRSLQPSEPWPLPRAGGPDAAADPEQRGRPVGAGEHDQA